MYINKMGRTVKEKEIIIILIIFFCDHKLVDCSLLWTECSTNAKEKPKIAYTCQGNITPEY